MKSPRSPKRRVRALSLVFLLLPAALFVPGGIANAEHNENSSDHEKITICHATGSESNPYVEITINESGLNGHAKQPHSGTDIIPAPAGGCPGPVAPPEPVDVCPNVDGNQATVPSDLVVVDGQCVTPTPPPAPTDVCPNIDGNQATVPTGQVIVDGQCVTPATPTTPDGPTPTTPDATPTADGATPDAAPAAAADAAAPTASPAEDTTIEATAGAADVPAGEATAGAAQTANGELPFTGAPTWIVAFAGMLLMLTGSMLHRRAARVATATTQH